MHGHFCSGTFQRHQILAVVTQPDRPAHRGQRVTASAVKARALDAGIPVIQPPRLRDPEWPARLREIGADLAVVVAFGQILPKAVLDTAVQATRNRRIGLLATQATVDAGRYAELVHALDAGVELVPVACPRLVPLIESDDPFGAQTTDAVREYAAPLKEAGADTVILGCTHYPLIRPIFQRVFGRGVTLVFSAEETAREVAETLARKGIENDEAREGSYRFLTTGDPAAFRALGERFLQLPLGEVEHVAVPDLIAA